MDALSYKGRSLSTGDVVVFQQRDKQAAYYVDAGAGYREVPEFFNPQEKQLTPDASLTGERIQTPRGSFYVTAMSREQIEAAGYCIPALHRARILPATNEKERRSTDDRAGTAQLEQERAFGNYD